VLLFPEAIFRGALVFTRCLWRLCWWGIGVGGVLADEHERHPEKDADVEARVDESGF
jgi:hypothetical protein